MLLFLPFLIEEVKESIKLLKGTLYCLYSLIIQATTTAYKYIVSNTKLIIHWTLLFKDCFSLNKNKTKLIIVIIYREILLLHCSEVSCSLLQAKINK